MLPDVTVKVFAFWGISTTMRLSVDIWANDKGAIVELETGKILGISQGILVSYDRTTEGTRIEWRSVVRRGERCRYQYDIRIERVWNEETIWGRF